MTIKLLIELECTSTLTNPKQVSDAIINEICEMMPGVICLNDDDILIDSLEIYPTKE